MEGEGEAILVLVFQSKQGRGKTGRYGFFEKYDNERKGRKMERKEGGDECFSERGKGYYIPHKPTPSTQLDSA